MSRISTDSRPRSGSRFRRALTVTITGLLVLCAAFAALGYLQGPKLSSAQADPEALVSQSGQQVRLFANQAVAQVRPDQVTVTPATAFDVTTEGSLIAVQFGERLDYATEYSLTIDGVTSAYDSRASTLEYRFTTSSPDLYFLDRGTPDDSIVRTWLAGSERETVYTAPRIQDFVPLRNLLAVVTLSEDRLSSLDLVNVADGVRERLLLPGAGVVGDLGVAASGSMFGFTHTTATTGPTQIDSRVLYTVDLNAGSIVRPVLDLDGEPMNVLGWQFAGSSTTIIALNSDHSLLMIDPVSASITPLGQLLVFDRVSIDGSVVTGIDLFGNVAIPVAEGTQTIPEASPIDGEVPYLGSFDVLPNGDRIAKAVLPTDSPTKVASLLIYDDGVESRILYRTVEDRGSIVDFSISPNGQYVAVETIPNNESSVLDGYHHDSRSTSTTTVIVDVRTGAFVRSFEGFSLEW